VGKRELIEAFQQSREDFLDAIDGLADDEFLRPGAVGIWSVKDVLAHLTAWESELVTALVKIEHGKKGTPPIVQIDDIDEWNAEQYHASAGRPLNIIWDDFQGVGKYLIEAIGHLDDRVLDDNRKFDWMEGEPLSYLVYENAIWHEEEHADEIRAWRESLEADE
jgi:hypothetical protein